MLTRETFIKDQAAAAAGIVFTGCGVTDVAPTQAQAGGQRRQVVVNGRRVKTVDAHAHAHVVEAQILMGRKPEKLRPGQTFLDRERDRLREMDLQGVDVEALSINPYWYEAERELASEVVKIQNEKLTELCARHPDRFVAFASVALQHPDLAIEQLNVAVKRLGMRGVAVGAHVNGVDFSEPQFHPFWAAAEQLGVLIFIHPSFEHGSGLGTRLGGNGWLRNVIGNPLDTTIALSHLIFEGTLDRFPGLKILAAHGGGYLPFYSARSDHVCLVQARPHRQPSTPPIVLKKKPSQYLKQLYYDSIVFTPEALLYLAAQVGSGQIVLGSDHPSGWVKNPVDLILEAPNLSDAERAAMLGDTAANLLGIES